VDGFLGAGLIYRGPLPGRDRDRFCVGVAAAHFSDEVRAAKELEGTPLNAWETNLEIAYRYRVARWLYLQADFQYVFNPSGDPELDDAVVVGGRLGLSF